MMIRVDKLTRIMMALLLALTSVPSLGHAAGDQPSWGQDGWPRLPRQIRERLTWSGGEGAKRPLGPDGKTVEFTGLLENGRPVVITTDGKGRVWTGVVEASPKGKTFADAIKFKISDAAEKIGFPMPPPPPGKIERVVTDAIDTVGRLVPGAGMSNSPPPPPAEWGKDGWPSIPRSPQDMQVWTGGEGAKRPVGPDGHGEVRFTQGRVDGRPIVIAIDHRTNEVHVGHIKERPGRTFADSVEFKVTTHQSYSDANIRPLEIGPPSTWERATYTWNRLTRPVLRQVRRAFAGEQTFLDIRQGRLGGTATEAADVLARFPTSALTFSFALGLAAAYRLTTDYPNNPVAWSRYADQMNDPIFWVSLAGFSLGMAPAIAWMKKTPPGLMRQMPIFVGGLAAGAFVQVAIETFARDPDVSACLGFGNMFATGDPTNNSRELPFKERDLKACDRAYNGAKMKKLALDTIVTAAPTMAAVGLSGSVFYWMLYQIQTSSAINRFAAAAAPLTGGGRLAMALRGGGAVGTLLVFIALSDIPQEWTSRFANTQRLTWAGFNGPVYAGNLARAEDDLFKTWERVRKSGWTDEEAPSNDTAVCYDANRISGQYFDCGHGKDLDFSGVLQTYHQLGVKWRSHKLNSVMSAYSDWLEKVSTYRDLLNQTKTFYQKALAKILYTRKNPSASATDPMVFNQQNMDIKTTSPVFPNEWDRSLVARFNFVENKSGSWMHVSTPRLEEFLTTSMACGPEVEGQSTGGFLNTVGLWAGQTLGFTGPRQMIEDEQGVLFKTRGYKVIFHPPRITKSLPGTNASVCEKIYDAGWSKRVAPARFFYTFLDWFAPPTLNKVEVVVDGKAYDGLLSYIQDNVRETVLSPQNLNDFDQWWADYVEAEDRKLTESMLKSYAKVVQGPFMTTLREPDYYWCDQNANLKDSRLEHFLRQLRNPGEVCASQNAHRLANGVLNGLRDQARLYTAMMLDLYVSNSGVMSNVLEPDRDQVTRFPRKVAEIENRVVMPARRMLKAYDEFVDGYVNGVGAKTPNELMQVWLQEYKQFLALVLNEGQTGLTFRGQPLTFGADESVVKVKETGELVTLPARPTMQAVWMGQLANALLQVMGEWQAYSRLATIEPMQQAPTAQ